MTDISREAVERLIGQYNLILHDAPPAAETLRALRGALDEATGGIEHRANEEARHGNREALEGAEGESSRLRELLNDLRIKVNTYRLRHDLFGDGDMRTGRAWDEMRRAEYAAADYLERTDTLPYKPQEDVTDG